MRLEPTATAILLAIFGLLLGVSVVSSRASERTGVPVVLLFLGVGMLAGSEGFLGIRFDDYSFAFRAGTTALVLILFDGGLNTPTALVRQYWKPAAALSTLGVALTAGFLAIAAFLFGLPLPVALLLGAVVSSTDAATVFSVLRGSGIHLRKRPGATLELESGLNDPLAVLLTISLTTALVGGSISDVSWLSVAGRTVAQLVIGGVAGIWIGIGGRTLLRRVTLGGTGLYPALTLALALLSFGVTSLLQGSGFLAVYLTGLMIGNAELPTRTTIARVHDALAWLSQIGMFLLLGLLVYPSRLAEVALIGLGLAFVLMLVARPLAVWLTLLPFQYPVREKAFIAWGGLRGAVPIILATYPVLRGVPGAEQIFDITFFVVVVNMMVTGGSVPWMARRLALEAKEPPAPPALLEISSTRPLRGDLLSYYVDEALDVAGTPVAAIPFPEGVSVALILRDDALLAPKPETILEVGDHVYVVASAEERPFVQLLFGRPEES
jgi:cell volume regulation protein A